jgi:phosphoribosyl 1,2-cyclic phosphodiesterase
VRSSACAARSVRDLDIHRPGCNTPRRSFDEAQIASSFSTPGSGLVKLRPIGATSYRADALSLDHVQGLPFFAPLYRPGGALTVWAPELGRTFADLETMFEAPFFPVPYDRLPSRPAIKMLSAGETEINGFEIGIQPLNHPGGAFAYRIRGAGGTLVYATDHEFGDPAIDEALAAFAAGASAVILDAHFTPEELPAHKGWGHGDWSQCAQFASACGAANLWLFHHKPGRSDVEVSRIEAQARRIFASTDAAREGVSFEF